MGEKLNYTAAFRCCKVLCYDNRRPATKRLLIILAIVGVVLYQAMRVIERRYLFWSGEHMRAIGS